MEVSEEELETLRKAQEIVSRMENKYPFKDDHVNILFNVEVRKLHIGLESMIGMISKYFLR